MKFELKAKGIKDFESYIAKSAVNAEKAAALSINDMTRKVYARSKRTIMSQVNLPASYLDGRDSGNPRLRITRFAKPGSLVAGVEGRQRATSLARFDVKQMYGTGKNGKRIKTGVSVRVKGSRQKIPKAFLVNLKNGNKGVALRVPHNEGVKGKKFAGQPLSGSRSSNSEAYLLYGPSVQQLFSNEVAEQGLHYVEDNIEREFKRQFARLNGG